jgi:uncharacterized protein YukJ
MPLGDYGALKGRVVGSVAETDPDSPHFQIHVRSSGVDYRIAVNVKSQEAPSELLYVADDDFRHPIIDRLASLEEGFVSLPSRAGGMALDFIRGNLFKPSDMRPLPPNLPGPDNDLSERLDHYVGKASRDQAAVLYAFGQRWGPEADLRDKVFGFLPGNGVHDIHITRATWAASFATTACGRTAGCCSTSPISTSGSASSWPSSRRLGTRTMSPVTPSPARPRNHSRGKPTAPFASSPRS